MAKDYYKILGIKRTATPEEVTKAYRQKAMRLHPDRCSDRKKAAATKKFQEIQEAYATLSDESNRNAYDSSKSKSKRSDNTRTKSKSTQSDNTQTKSQNTQSDNTQTKNKKIKSASTWIRGHSTFPFGIRTLFIIAVLLYFSSPAILSYGQWLRSLPTTIHAFLNSPSQAVSAHVKSADLIKAVIAGNTDMVRSLLASGADPQGVDDYKDTALHKAARYGSGISAMHLLHYGAYVDSTNREGRTPLQIAAARGYVNTAKVLVKNGASIYRGERGFSAYDRAVRNNRTKVVDLFHEHIKEKGKRTGIVRQQNKTVANTTYDISGVESTPKPTVGEAKKEIDEQALKVEAIKTPIEEVDENALIIESIKGDVVEVKNLIDQGVDVNYENKEKQTALMFAAWYGRHEIVNLLIANGAFVNQIDKNGKTARMWARQQAHISTVDLLDKHGAYRR